MSFSGFYGEMFIDVQINCIRLWSNVMFKKTVNVSITILSHSKLLPLTCAIVFSHFPICSSIRGKFPCFHGSFHISEQEKVAAGQVRWIWWLRYDYYVVLLKKSRISNDSDVLSLYESHTLFCFKSWCFFRFLHINGE